MAVRLIAIRGVEELRVRQHGTLTGSVVISHSQFDGEEQPS